MTSAAVVAEVKSLAARLEEQPDGFDQYVTARMDRVQRLSDEISRLTPAQSRALSEVFVIE